MLIRSLYQDLMPDLHKVRPHLTAHSVKGSVCGHTSSSVLSLSLLCCFPTAAPQSASAYCTTATGYCCNADFLSTAPSPHITFSLSFFSPHCPFLLHLSPSLLALCNSNNVIVAAAAVLTLRQGQRLRPLSLSLCFLFFSLFGVRASVPRLGSFFSPEHAKPAVLQRRAARVSKVGAQEGGGAAGRVCQNRAGNKVVDTHLPYSLLRVGASYLILQGHICLYTERLWNVIVLIFMLN